ncbi:MAG TPA: CBS domain-containing protein [Terriglobia bacterium]|jgi:signal-transduction protein with cAMP-binding, CBS, and nucleotidyltransferase domain
MSRECPVIDGNLSLRTLAEEFFLRTGRRCFLVLESGRQSGLITVHELKRVERERWPLMTVSQVAIPLNRIHSVSPDAEVAQAMDIMVRENINQLPVISNGELAGVITRRGVLQFLKAHGGVEGCLTAVLPQYTRSVSVPTRLPPASFMPVFTMASMFAVFGVAALESVLMVLVI